MTVNVALASPTSNWVKFAVGQSAFGVPIESVDEVLPNQPITRVPGAPRHVLGLIHHRGRVVTVIDGAGLLTYEIHTAWSGQCLEGMRIVVLRNEGAAILVDRVDDVAAFDRGALVHTDNKLGYIGAVVEDGQPITLVDLATLIRHLVGRDLERPLEDDR